MKKRILAMLLAAMLIVGLLPVSALAADATSGTCGENVTWSFDEASGTLTISGAGEIDGYYGKYWNGEKYPVDAPWGSYDVHHVIIEAGITGIGHYTFNGLNNLETVSISNTVTSIGEGAFSNCPWLDELNIPASLVEIDANFLGVRNRFVVDGNNPNYSSDEYGVLFDKNQETLICAPSALKGEYSVPETVITICEDAFAGNHGPTKITIPSSVSEIGYYAFGEVHSLTGIYVDPANKNFSSDDRGVLFNKDQSVLIQAPTCLEGEYVVPATVKEMGKDSFVLCGVTSLIISDSVEQLGPTGVQYAPVHYCGKLVHTKISNKVQIIPTGMYDQCYKLASVDIPDSVVEICGNAFKHCESLTGVYIPVSVKKHGDAIFLRCSELKDIYYEGTEEQWKEIEIVGYSNTPFEGATIHYNIPRPKCSEGEHLAVRTLPVKATCQKVGEENGTHCCICGAVVTVPEEVPVMDHEYTSNGYCRWCYKDQEPCTHTPVTDAAVAATCTKTGLTEGSHCSKCNEVLTAQEVVPALGHKAETVKGKAATCTASGLTDGAKCSVCGEVLTKQETIPALGHKFSGGKCSVCGAKDPNYVEPTPTPPAVTPTPTPPAVTPTPTPPAGNNPFTDVPNDAWYAAPVLWAKANNVTGGKTETTFGPDDGCTRAQVVTFLWAANGKPEPKSMNNPFKDVADNAWYLKPVLWAVEQGITGGVAEGKFGPEQTCTRAQIATFLYAAAGKPEVSGKSSFKDVADSDWFAKPIIWAAQNEVTGGIGDGKFGPNNTCTRAQVVTFLYKVYG